ncbi:UDP-N-acetylmuramoyl-L-alanine--D-glutamate ligase [Leucobacter sp. M11]|uniref:UDP-N-acetylmuramoyl-L-alanine--D-glutamate ligase n=1 Tax=Leucobacter sp. M11 TaxID=2993565 RepID=UPI002D8069BC|nr:UDP-N-acetylmuramoyl-L-alanine--D-glutamate ligase [Leucobacter sp. M11]
MTAEARERVLALGSWHDDWTGLRVAVLGLGVTGFSVADTLVELGARVRVIFGQADEERQNLLDVIGSESLLEPDTDAQLVDLIAFDPELVVVSPGYRPDHPLTRWAEERGTVVWGDIQLAWRLRDKTERIAEWISVTGTNGKTTTSQLTAHMLVAGGLRAAPVGNIGVPVLDALRDPQGYDALVVELSSFQLHRLGDISPHASVVLNVADDHLDWHGNARRYRTAKARVYENTKVACVYNRMDAATEQMVQEADVVEGARAISFGLDTPGPSGFGIVDGILCDRGFHEDRRNSALELVTVDELAEHGLAAPHLLQNILAAAALARSMGVEPAAIREAVLGFRMDAHRVETVLVRDGITWVDDSKATNAHAATASLRAFPRVVWVLGGLFKGVDIAELVREHAPRLAGLVVIGVDQSEAVAAIERHAPDVPRFLVDPGDTEDTMLRAVRYAASIAERGDTVLLAPAAASMDQFTDYGDRGRRFQAAVQEFLGGEADDDSAAQR